MNIDVIEQLLNNHWQWLKDETTLESIRDDWFVITTPYLDRHNDCIQIYVSQQGEQFILTDDGYTLNDLISSGCPLDQKKDRELLNQILQGYGVQNNDNQLQIYADAENFPLKTLNIIQAMLGVHQLFDFIARSAPSVETPY